ncbi:MAG: hypothetical protein J5830_02395 [Clostridia bacterium]|nr:hypothetical protein [Clostridia bacterium]
MKNILVTAKRAALIFSILFVLLLSEVSCTRVSAYEEKTTVYGSRNEQHYVYNDICKTLKTLAGKDVYEQLFVQQKCRVVEESITPIYTSYLWNWARWDGSRRIQKKFHACTNYVAKIVYPDDSFAGNLRAMYMSKYGDNSKSTEDELLVNIIPADDVTVSYSYADHAERIRLILGTDEIIPPSDVVLVSVIGTAGYMFYISNDDFDGFIKADSSIYYDGHHGTIEYADFGLYNKFIKSDALQSPAGEILLKHPSEILRYEEYDVENPNRYFQNKLDFSWPDYTKDIIDTNNPGDPTLPLNNVINCYEYFGLDSTGADLWEIVLATCAAAAVIAASFFIVRGVGKKKPEHQE